MANSKAEEIRTARALMAEINGQHGAGTISLASDPRWAVRYIPTGIAPIDHLLQGGLPCGRFVTCHGDYSTLKTYIGLCSIASAQKRGMIAALIDTEHAYDPMWAEFLGIDLKQLIMEQPETGEAAIDLAEMLIRGGADLIVFDSVAASLPQAERDKSMQDSVQMTRQAALMSKAMRKLTAPNKKTAVLWVNQTRVNIGVTYGDQESVPGGKALPFYSSYIVGLYKAGTVKEENDVYLTGPDGRPVKRKIRTNVGTSIRVVLKKSKLNKPYRETQFVFDHNTGHVDDWAYLANLALDEGLIGYERGRWWRGRGKKMTPAAFRGAVPLEDLKQMLAGKVEGLESAGDAPQGSRPEESASQESSGVTARASTRTVVRAKSGLTAAPKTNSSKSKTPSRVTHSPRST